MDSMALAKTSWEGSGAIGAIAAFADGRSLWQTQQVEAEACFYYSDNILGGMVILEILGGGHPEVPSAAVAGFISFFGPSAMAMEAIHRPNLSDFETPPAPWEELEEAESINQAKSTG